MTQVAESTIHQDDSEWVYCECGRFTVLTKRLPEDGMTVQCPGGHLTRIERTTELLRWSEEYQKARDAEDARYKRERERREREKQRSLDRQRQLREGRYKPRVAADPTPRRLMEARKLWGRQHEEIAGPDAPPLFYRRERYG